MILHKFLGPFGVAYVGYPDCNTWENATPEDLEFYRLAKEYYWTADGWVKRPIFKFIRYKRMEVPFIPLTATEVAMRAEQNTVAIDTETVRMDQWGDQITINSKNIMSDTVGHLSGIGWLDTQPLPAVSLLDGYP